MAEGTDEASVLPNFQMEDKFIIQESSIPSGWKMINYTGHLYPKEKLGKHIKQITKPSCSFLNCALEFHSIHYLDSMKAMFMNYILILSWSSFNQKTVQDEYGSCQKIQGFPIIKDFSNEWICCRLLHVLHTHFLYNRALSHEDIIWSQLGQRIKKKDNEYKQVWNVSPQILGVFEKMSKLYC